MLPRQLHRSASRYRSVTAPLLADDTDRAYLASTPLV
jgi:hypothetical protein